MMMVSLRSRPSWERSYNYVSKAAWGSHRLATYLDIVALMVEATLAEQPVVDNMVDVELVQKGIAVLMSGLACRYD
jgi:hypothetical protein